MSQANSVDITLFGKQLTIHNPYDDPLQLHDAADYLSEQVTLLPGHIATASTEKIAITLALNLAHELLTTRDECAQTISTVEERIEHLNHLIEQAIESIDPVTVEAVTIDPMNIEAVGIDQMENPLESDEAIDPIDEQSA